MCLTFVLPLVWNPCPPYFFASFVGLGLPQVLLVYLLYTEIRNVLTNSQMSIATVAAPGGFGLIVHSLAVGLEAARQADTWYRDNREFLDTASSIIQHSGERASAAVQQVQTALRPGPQAVTNRLGQSRRDRLRDRDRNDPSQVRITNYYRLRGSGRQAGGSVPRFRFAVRRTYPRRYRRRGSVRRF